MVKVIDFQGEGAVYPHQGKADPGGFANVDPFLLEHNSALVRQIELSKRDLHVLPKGPPWVYSHSSCILFAG